MEFLLGFIEWNAAGRTTRVAETVFSSLGFFGNKYFIITLVTIICSIILFFLLKNYIDENNKKLWQLFLMCPGLLIYSNAPTKETLFLYPAFFYIILECRFLINKTNLFSANTLIRICLLFLMLNIRGELVFPYFFLFFICLILKNTYIGGMSNNLNFKNLIIISFFISIFLVFLVTNINPIFFESILSYLQGSFENQYDLFRPLIDLEYVKNPINFFQIQYLALFPTPNELLQKPYKIIIIIDSLLLFYNFKNSWKKLFKTVSLSKTTKKIISILFTFITIIYFTIFGIVGSYNLGSSQRFRINYLPLAIIFPLILDKQIREKQKSRFSQL
ncbi:MAG: hypothetical protein JJ845_001610 [Prochlorococcus marinus CUG1436]|nr:hypothetical protein [Prochlorococcus marinus CUG1436]